MTEPTPEPAEQSRTLVIENKVSRAGLLAIVFLALAALIAVVGLVSVNHSATHDVHQAQAAVAAARSQVDDLTLEQRCRADAAANVSRATGALISGFSLAFEGGYGTDRVVIRSRLSDLRNALDAALAAQVKALNSCKSN
jgi:hypothetical protein